MLYRVSGFNGRGEATIVDPSGRLVACGEMYLEAYAAPDKGEEHPVVVKIIWTPEENE